jgi:hypothetical protein
VDRPPTLINKINYFKTEFFQMLRNLEAIDVHGVQPFGANPEFTLKLAEQPDIVRKMCGFN